MSILWTSFLCWPMASLKLVLAGGQPRFAKYTFSLCSKHVTDRQPTDGPTDGNSLSPLIYRYSKYALS